MRVFRLSCARSLILLVFVSTVSYSLFVLYIGCTFYIVTVRIVEMYTSST